MSQSAGADTASLGKRDRHSGNDRQVQAIDVLLANKSETFSATVFELCRQLVWLDDEPGFLMAVATGQLQAMITQ